MKFNWGWGIAALYIGFVLLIVVLVVGSVRQRCDLVSKDYYGEELVFQKVIDAGKNQSNLSSPISIVTGPEAVTINFPDELKNKTLQGDVLFYSAVNSDWDHSYKMQPADHNSIVIDRKTLHSTRYTVKIHCTVDGKSYYQESDVSLL